MRKLPNKQEIYDAISRILTDYETCNPEDPDYPSCEDFYQLLVTIQRRWEDTITAITADTEN